MTKTVSFKKPAPKPAVNVDDWVQTRGPAVPAESDAVAVAPVTAPVRMKRFTIDVPADLHARVKVACARRGAKMADEVRRLLEQEFVES